MQKSTFKRWYYHSFWLALLLHILLLLGISTRIVFLQDNPVPKVPPRVTHTEAPAAIPSYFYTGSVQPTPIQQTPPTPKPIPPQPVAKSIPESPHGIYKPHPQNVLAMSRAAIQGNFIKAALSNSQAEEPILLIGDQSKTVDPLVRLLGRSLSAHFHYPRMEGTFGLRGRVYVRLVLHPEGYYSDVQIVKSSDNENFDKAALYAINSAPTVVGANKFLKSPRQFLIGFIFD
jgi:TonB family protein